MTIIDDTESDKIKQFLQDNTGFVYNNVNRKVGGIKMLPNFPVLTEEQVEQYTNEGYVLVFKFLNAIQEEHPKDLVLKTELETNERFKQGDKVTKVLNFRDGYNFLKNSDFQYNLRSQLAGDLTQWACYYNISDETNPKVRKDFLEGVDRL